MEKKKNNNDAIIIWGVILVIAMFLAYNFGLALTDNHDAMLAKGMTEEQISDTSPFDCANDVFDYFETELSTFSLNRLIWNDHIKKSMMIVGFVWFLTVAYIYSNPKNLITGKEYGTARWGKESDVHDCFAKTIKNKEIAQAKKCKSILGRRKAEKDARATSKMYAREMKEQELLNLDLWFESELELITEGIDVDE